MSNYKRVKTHGKVDFNKECDSTAFFEIFKDEHNNNNNNKFQLRMWLRIFF